MSLMMISWSIVHVYRRPFFRFSEEADAEVTGAADALVDASELRAALGDVAEWARAPMCPLLDSFQDMVRRCVSRASGVCVCRCDVTRHSVHRVGAICIDCIVAR